MPHVPSRFEHEVRAPAGAFDDRAAELLADAARGAGATSGPQDDPPVTEVGGALHGGVSQRGADAAAASVGGHGDEHLAGFVDACDTHDAATFHCRQPKPIALPKRLHQRPERLRVA
jgi:hypothetical protein